MINQKKEKKEKKLNENNKNSGITLIALVVTIIVLLILAGISISMLTGENGILQRATQSKDKTERTEIVENAKLDILEKISEKNGENLTASELEEILTSPDYSTQGTLSSEENILEGTLTSKDEKYEIPVSEIYNGNLKNNEKKVISFELNLSGYEDTVELQCEEGMTWAEWAQWYSDPIYLSPNPTTFPQYVGHFQGSLQELILSCEPDKGIFVESPGYLLTMLYREPWVQEKPKDVIVDASTGVKYKIFMAYDG